MNSLFSFLEKNLGFTIDEKRKKAFIDYVKSRKHELGIETDDLYLEHMKRYQSEQHNIIDYLTIGETYFFRNADHWSAFKEYALPAIIRKKKSRDLKIWSVGCSTGEEPYSIAMSLLGYPGIEGWNINIQACDINQKAIEKAQKGVYRKNSFRLVPEEIIQQYFIQKDSLYEITNKVKNMVTFETMSLSTIRNRSLLYQNFDIIFCKNVLIYFEENMAKDIISFFWESLNQKSFLFLGYSESRLVSQKLFNHVNTNNTYIFEKLLPGEVYETKKLKNTLVHQTKIRNLTSRIKVLQRPKKNEEDKTVKLKAPDCLEKKKEKEEEVYNKALELFSQEQFIEASQLLEKSSCESLRISTLKALLFLNMGQLEEAIQCSEAILHTSKIYPEAYVLKAMIAQEKGNISEAIENNKRAIFLDKSFFAPQFKLGNLYKSKSNIEASKRYFLNAITNIAFEETKRITLFCGFGSKELFRDICKRSIQ